MLRTTYSAPRAGFVLLTFIIIVTGDRLAMAQQILLQPSTMPRVGTIEERYQSYNVEMVEVTGGNFWRPYGAKGDDLFKYRPPIDLANARLRMLAAALGPAYVRISGTWANATFFPQTDAAPATPPPGFDGVLSRERWKGVVDFANAVDAKIVTSFANSAGTHDANGAWTTDQAKRFIDYTRSIGGDIAAAEFMNEPNFAVMEGAPPGYDAKAYGRDFKTFHAFASQMAPGMLILGPGSVGESTGAWGVTYGSPIMLETRDLLAAMRPASVDRFSYHHYGASSQRCGTQTRPEDALSERWLKRTDESLAFYRALRDQFQPGKPFWLTETADASCGGNPWARTFVDTFRYLDQLGRLAKQDVKVVMHNTLVASDYGLVDDKTLAPKPNFWGALLWRKLMGTVVLESGIPLQKGLHLYAHCLRGEPGGVALLAINNSQKPTTISIPTDGERYTLYSRDLKSSQIQLNERELSLSADDKLPNLQGRHIPAGDVELAPSTITFLALTLAANVACR
jgi:hypothetical protein